MRRTGPAAGSVCNACPGLGRYEDEGRRQGKKKKKKLESVLRNGSATPSVCIACSGAGQRPATRRTVCFGMDEDCFFR